MISVGAGAAARRARGRKRAPKPIEVQFRTIVSPHQLNSRWGRRIYWLVLVAVLVLFTLAFVFPLYWMATGALKTPEELAQMPPTLFPADPSPEAFFEAWDLFDIGTLLANTAYYSLGGWVVCMAVDVSAAYALSKLRPMFGNVILGMMLATLMIPAMVVLIPLYVTVVDLGLLNNPWALWLPAAANGFNIFLLKRFFDSIPRELIEAAQIDGAGGGADPAFCGPAGLPAHPGCGLHLHDRHLVQGLRLAAAGHDGQRQDDDQRGPVADGRSRHPEPGHGRTADHQHPHGHRFSSSSNGTSWRA
ncbi:carbohydrate ABC transporter permease [Nonomuraea salmonea]|uniref:carbohydrate ABC transporter permease n=1 Tax=Nonomuraea salmonea TaxID=46181 RepID=UPI002FE7B29B